MKVDTINISSFKLHTPEPLCLDTYGFGRYRDASSATTNTGGTSITDPVYVQVFEASAPNPFNDKIFIVVIAQPMAKTPGLPLSPLTEAGGLVVGGGLAHVVDVSTV